MSGSAPELSNPILNSPYRAPEAHFEIDENTGGPTGVVLPGRRPSESFIPVPPTKQSKNKQEAFNLDTTGERREQNTLINDIRREVEKWRASNWNGVTPYSRKLLIHWQGGPRDDPVFFCQREAGETAIFLAEVAGRHATADYRRRLEPENEIHNDGLPRVALKMATGTGKTVVMAMLIAWQTINKVMTPNDARFAKRFLIVTPGITIRDRLGVLYPSREDSYYSERDLVPPDLWEALLQAQVQIINYHVFLPRDAKEIHGVSKTTRKLLRGDTGPQVDAFQETPEMIAARIMRGFGTSKGELVVLNDEAHHCYQDKSLDAEKIDKEEQERNREARVWLRGLLTLRKRAGIKVIYDLSATPYYLKGSGYNEGYIFPWVVSDFSLMDAIESGIVKVPRIPVDDDAGEDQPVYLNLWDNIDPPLPKRVGKKAAKFGPAGWPIPKTLEGALLSLYRSYETNNKAYEETLAAQGEPPPVMIVVCPNTIVSNWMFEWIAGRQVELPSGETQIAPGKLALLSNVQEGKWAPRLRTILVDSVQLESGQPLGADFRKDAAHEIEAFKRAYRERNPGADVEKLTDADYLREAMNTIGKPGKLGEHIRCVVSVGMLTEGWDANTVTHILGVRPFRSQLLCEQVVGRGLRRRSYAADPVTERFEPEYAEVYGVPFAFIRGDKEIAKPKPKSPAIDVYAVPSRSELAIRFPKLDGYRVELPDRPLRAEFTQASQLHLDAKKVALWTKMSPVVGAGTEVNLDDIRDARPQQVAFQLAARLLMREEYFAAHDGAPRPWLFPQLVAICKRWLDGCVTMSPPATKGYLLLAQAAAEATEKVFGSIVSGSSDEDRMPILLPILRRFDPEGSTDDVHFATRKVVMSPPPIKSHLNHVVLDGPKGNTWEVSLAQLLENDTRVLSYVKNERLDFAIPYAHKGRSHDYVPDFLVRLRPKQDDDHCMLVVEVSGSFKSPGPTAAKAEAARNQWCRAVNNQGDYGRWGYVEVRNPLNDAGLLNDAIENFCADRSVSGLPA